MANLKKKQGKRATFYLREDLIDEIDRLAEETRYTKTAIVEIALDKGLSEFQVPLVNIKKGESVDE